MSHEAVGEAATRIAARIGGDGIVLACEPGDGTRTLLQALELRRAGTRFFLSTYVDDVRSGVLRERSAAWCAAYATWDEVRLLLDDAASEIAGAKPVIDDADASALIEAMRLSDGVIVRSWREHGRLLDAIGIVPRETSVVIDPDPDVPAAVSGERTDVVVYAPNDRADELAPFIVTLADLEVPVTIVARDRPTIPSRIYFEPAGRAAQALGRARVIVDATSNDPGTAIALAKLGRPLVVAASGGAGEVLRDAGSYDLWNRRSLLAAVTNAFGNAAPQLRANGFDDRPAPRTPPAFGADAPLVSVIVTTYNRPALLDATLATIQAQTYPNIEIIVVNDAGADVRDVVARYSRARLIEQPENRGPAAARNRGLADAHGTYATLFDDDDQMFPDHVAALANALISSGLDVAYGQMINAFAQPDGAGGYELGSLAGHVALLDHADIQWAGSIATTAFMFRRTLIEEIGGVDESIVAAEDYEFWLRAATGREWARVPDITSLYFIRLDRSNRSGSRIELYGAAHRAIYAKHPSDRPLVQAGRQSMLEFFARRAAPGA